MTLRIIPQRFAPHAQGLLRIVAALLFMQHGLAKLFGVPHVAMFDGLKLFSLLGAAGVLELVGGLLILIGLFTRPVAFILAGQMAVAYFFFHAGQDFWPFLNKGELAALYCFVFLFFAAAGPGAFALDRE
ncbi:MAG: DoxX family protein [Alphaproteobacteria bacterium]|nr:DoxX family protein [Alphaproteobacteria bacterium]MBM3624682.1 DoxX family protein [Alphaproteobacteria bacterium]MBM3639782.1 DoxX family protein [Alphaproteobacteria bacterium]